MITTDYALELVNVSSVGCLEGTSFLQKLFRIAPKRLVLKEISLEVHGGEVMAILGSKGSGKRNLLDLISHHVDGHSVRGEVLLNNARVSSTLFQESCGYVTRTVDFVPGLTVRQVLNYAAQLSIGSRVSTTVKRGRVKQVMADLALNQVANRDINVLTTSEYRRLSIAAQLIRDPVVLLLDEPTADLDPLNTYFIVSILSNYAKKYNRIMLMTMEKPRSDIFPFLDRVTYLCLGDIVYTGNTRMMIDYFRNIGFPCPELENPLMYYLCLSTVDRRSRDRLMDSSNQIAILVQKFRAQGSPFRKFADSDAQFELNEPADHRIPLTYYGRPSTCSVFSALVRRPFRVLGNGLCGFNTSGMTIIFLKLFLLPLLFLLIFLFYFRLSNFQQSFVSRNGLLFNCLTLTSLVSGVITAVTFAPHRTRFFQEKRDGLYRGSLFILSQIIYNFPLSLMTVLAASAIIYWPTGLRPEGWRWAMFYGVLWSCYAFVELLTMLVMMVVKSSYNTISVVFTIVMLCIVTSSGTVRTLSALPHWLYSVSYGIIYRYAGAFLNENEFRGALIGLPSSQSNGSTSSCDRSTIGHSGCFFLDGDQYLALRYPAEALGTVDDLRPFFANFGYCFAFYGGMVLVNIIAYALPLPSFIRKKYRD